jgi:hypothetical protein
MEKLVSDMGRRGFDRMRCARVTLQHRQAGRSVQNRLMCESSRGPAARPSRSRLPLEVPDRRHDSVDCSRSCPAGIRRVRGKVVTIPLAPRTARAIDLVISERTEGPLFTAAVGRRLDRPGAAHSSPRRSTPGSPAGCSGGRFAR